VAEIERAIDCGAVASSPFGGGQSGGDDAPDLPFGRENTWRLNLNFSQAVYTGGRLAAQAALAGAGRESAELALTTSRAQLLFDVTQAYYDAALSDRLVAIAEATLGQAEATFKQVQVSFEAGAQPEFELLRSRVARDSQRPFIIRQRASREIAMLRLKQLIDVPAGATLELAASLGEPALDVPPVFAARLAAAEQVLRTEPSPVAPALEAPVVQERTAVKEVAAVVHLREAVVKATRAERMPSISVSSSYGRVAYPSGAFPAFGDFRTNWSVGASVQVPILTGGRQRGDEIVAQAELEQSQLQFEQTRKLADLDTRSAWAELAAASAVWQASAGTVEQAGRAYEIADVRYRAGISTQLELSDSRLLLQQAEATRAQAGRDLQVARARMALLPDLPLATGGAGRVAPQTAPQSPGTGGAAPHGSAAPQAPATAGQPRSASAAAAPAQSAVRQ
jgi:outer membrane protein TolC